jgi:hypothetical protein
MLAGEPLQQPESLILAGQTFGAVLWRRAPNFGHQWAIQFHTTTTTQSKHRYANPFNLHHLLATTSAIL